MARSSSLESSVLHQISEKRKKLLELYSIYGLTNHKVVRCSQELDVLINLIQETERPMKSGNHEWGRRDSRNGDL